MVKSEKRGKNEGVAGGKKLIGRYARATREKGSKRRF